jgi:hypothetical protein
MFQIQSLNAAFERKRRNQLTTTANGMKANFSTLEVSGQ